ncbi:hypothetical protein DV096_06575 [Bradymonadaceae bacterium TMQ3]|nr:hypothetical protein DV096_06575 [Bradymonadaceae bacterium TMQ3]
MEAGAADSAGARLAAIAELAVSEVVEGLARGAEFEGRGRDKAEFAGVAARAAGLVDRIAVAGEGGDVTGAGDGLAIAGDASLCDVTGVVTRTAVVGIDVGIYAALAAAEEAGF